ncbi:MAG: DHH family phosphoesterase [Erysipelotrichaceae bacterium]|nr:DHH family phosphoesterase [Erysipelotrichaceae bacterium]
MDSRTSSLKYVALAVFLLQVAILIILQFVFKQPFSLLAAIFTIIEGIVFAIIILVYEGARRERIIDVTRILGNDSKSAMTYAQTGIVIYDENYMITWASEFFDERSLVLIGEKVTKAIPGSEVILNGEADSCIVTVNDRVYEAVKSQTSPAFYIRDITELSVLQEQYNDESIVLGMIYLDNYDETIQYEDEQKIAMINTNIRQKAVEWGRGFGAVVRRVRSDRFIVIANRKILNDMIASRFSILESIKKEAENLDVAISASMGFAYGTADLLELDSMIIDLLELVLARGGDQVAVKPYGQEVRFYGSSSEASEKTSKVRARVMAQTLRGVIKDSDNVFVVPHKNADYDAIGSCLGVSRIAAALGKPVYLVFNGITIESSAEEALKQNAAELAERHRVIGELEAIEKLTSKSLVVVCDHHSMDQTSSAKLVESAGRIAIIDHHRRKTEANILAMMIYNEPSSSSAVELVSELIQYEPVKVELSVFETTFMYTGILVDTDGFRSRCSGRTFEVCAYLRKEGADIAAANDWLKETMEQAEAKTRAMKYSELINGNILVAALPEKEGTINRTLVAQIANYMLSIKSVDASFVIASSDEENIAVSGRSNGAINVQIILERMGGGGHLSAAGLQRKNSTVAELRSELLDSINAYLEGTDKHEDNTVK